MSVLSQLLIHRMIITEGNHPDVQSEVNSIYRQVLLGDLLQHLLNGKRILGTSGVIWALNKLNSHSVKLRRFSSTGKHFVRRAQQLNRSRFQSGISIKPSCKAQVESIFSQS